MLRRNDDRILVDSSAWIELLRAKGDAAIKSRLDELLEDDRAVWCDIVRVELWRGAGSADDQRTLQDFEKEVHSLEISTAVWDKGCELARLCCRKGKALPVTDLMVYACAVVYDLELLHRDQYFELLADIYPR